MSEEVLSFEEAIEKYDPVLGFEVHVELNTKTKMFDSAPNEFGDTPNTNVTPVSLGLPGALPMVNKTAVESAIKLGEKTEGDPMAMYLGDVATVPVNLAGVPALSLPGGLSEENNLPVGIQFTAPAREDARLYRVGAAPVSYTHLTLPTTF